MKNLLILFLTLISFNVFSAVLEEPTKQAITTNLNDIVIEILRGAKTAGGEIYQASKSAVIQSVDFAQEQVPLVVKEFLRWQIAKAIVWIVIFGFVSSLILHAGTLVMRFGIKEDDDECKFISWLIKGLGCFLLIVTLGTNGMIITKVSVAPRVFLIEYVADIIKAK